MKINDVFDAKRFWMVLRIDLMNNVKIRLLAVALLGIMIPVFSLLTPNQYGEATVDFNPVLESTILFIFGLFIAASALNKPLNAKHSVLTIYLLPASTIEKYLAIFFVRIAGYAILSAAIVIAGYYIVKWENPTFLHRSVNPTDPDELKKMWFIISGFFAVLQSIYFFCGLLFKKNVMLKTTGILIGSIIIGSFISSLLGIGTMGNFDFLTAWMDYLTKEQILTVSTLFFVGLPLFFWTLSFIRLTETEGR